MDDTHRLLQRQMKRYGVDMEKNPELASFISAISKSYKQYEKEQKIHNNSSAKLISKISSTNSSLKTTIETIDSFNYHVSHDLKTTVVNNMSLAKMASKYFQKDNKEKLSQVIDRLESNSKSGFSIIDKYLQISKFDSKMEQAEDNNLNIESSIQEVLDKTSLSDKLDVSIIKKDFDFIFISEVSLHSMLQNFMTNAYKYSDPKKKAKLEISLEKLNNKKVLKFTDNGLGIDLTKNRDKMFKPFVRLENKNIEGSGIGLFIIKKIVNRLGGSLSVESELGMGTTFIVQLPI